MVALSFDWLAFAVKLQGVKNLAKNEFFSPVTRVKFSASCVCDGSTLI